MNTLKDRGIVKLLMSSYFSRVTGPCAISELEKRPPHGRTDELCAVVCSVGKVLGPPRMARDRIGEV